MPDSTKTRIRKFNPGTFQTDEEVIEQFVVRNRELDIVLDVLRGNIDSASCQHTLIVAPRGRGKSMLLARAAAELRTNSEFSNRVFPVRFMEESQEIFNIADFWLETLSHIARECVSENPELAGELRARHSALNDRWGEQSLEDLARAAVMDAADRLGRKLVLMVENLQSLRKDVDKDFGWKLREILQTEPRIMLLSSATSRFSGLDDAEQPFFELFRIIDLKPLKTDECRKLWKIVSGDTVSQREIRPLEILTGGSPRLLVIVGGFAQHKSLHTLMEELVSLVDEHTEYFRGHLEVLGKMERRVYIAVLDLWRLSTPSEIAARARIDLRIVSTMLKRLADKGAVAIEGTGRKRTYAPAEPLYSIYYKLRRGRDEAAIVEGLIQFMSVFYSESENAELFPLLIAEGKMSPIIWQGLYRASAVIPEISKLLKEETETGFGDSLDKDSALIVAEELFLKMSESVKLGNTELAQDIEKEIVDRYRSSSKNILKRGVASTLNLSAKMLLEIGDVSIAIKKYEEIFKIFETDISMQEHVGYALIAKGFLQGKAGEIPAAILTFSEVINRYFDFKDIKFKKIVAMAMNHKGAALAAQYNTDDALSAYDELLELYTNSNNEDMGAWIAKTLIEKANILDNENKKELALLTWEEVVDRFGTEENLGQQLRVAESLARIGRSHWKSGRHEIALKFLNEVEQRFGGSNDESMKAWIIAALIEKAEILVESGQPKNSLKLRGEIERRLQEFWNNPNYNLLQRRARRIWTAALLEQDDLKAAIAVLTSFFEVCNLDSKETLEELLDLVFLLMNHEVIAAKLVEIFEKDHAKTTMIAPLIVALKQQIGENVRASDEVLSVAADIRKRLSNQHSMHTGHSNG